jgi:UDP-N-acetylglucosamine:LPS N-acetylglucosamine transferase
VCIRQEDANEARLASEIARLVKDDAARARMAAAARAHGRPRASHDVAQDLLGLSGIPERAGARVGSNGASAREGP